jgi:hypothetical protein
MSRSSISIIAAVGVVVVALVVLTRFRTERPPDAPAATQAAPAAPIVGIAATPGARAARPDAPPVPQAASQEPVLTAAQVERMQATAAALRERARFPPTSRPIVENLDPIVETRAVEERMSPPGQGRAPTLVVHSSSLSYEAPSPIILFARFIREWPNDRMPRPDAEIAGELVNAEDDVVAVVDLLDDGQERDIEAGDGIFTTRLTPTPEDVVRWNGLVRVRVYGKTSDGERRSAKTRFYYGAPSARLTGNYQDRLVNGNLEILAEIDVKALGEYRLDATLGLANAQLLAWGQNTLALEPGLAWMPVTFWGLTLREANQPGPYRLASIALANVTLKPPQLNDAIGTQYETAAYDPFDFSGDAYNDPKLLQRADRLDAKARGDTGGR